METGNSFSRSIFIRLIVVSIQFPILLNNDRRTLIISTTSPTELYDLGPVSESRDPNPLFCDDRSSSDTSLHSRKSGSIVEMGLSVVCTSVTEHNSSFTAFLRCSLTDAYGGIHDEGGGPFAGTP